MRKTQIEFILKLLQSVENRYHDHQMKLSFKKASLYLESELAARKANNISSLLWKEVNKRNKK